MGERLPEGLTDQLTPITKDPEDPPKGRPRVPGFGSTEGVGERTAIGVAVEEALARGDEPGDILTRGRIEENHVLELRDPGRITGQGGVVDEDDR